MSFGLKEQDLEIILTAIKNYTEIEKEKSLDPEPREIIPMDLM